MTTSQPDPKDGPPQEWEKVEDRPGWIRFSGNVKVCPNCWKPVALISDGSEKGRYDYDGQSTHVCALRVVPPEGGPRADEQELEESSDEACEAMGHVRDYLEERLTYRDLQPAMELVYAVGRTSRRHAEEYWRLRASGTRQEEPTEYDSPRWDPGKALRERDFKRINDPRSAESRPMSEPRYPKASER